MKKTWTWVLIIVGLLIIIRIALPFIVENYANKALQQMEGYEGSIDDIDLNLFRGAYQIDNLIVNSVTDSLPVPFISISEIDLSVQWSALFNGAFVGEIVLEQPVINFAVDEEASQDGTETDWPKVIKGLFPITINRFEIVDGVISYYDFTTEPEIDVHIENLDLLIKNLTNIEQQGQKLPSSIAASGYTTGNGEFNLNARFNALQEIPNLDLTMNIEQVNLLALNDFIRAYSNTDVEKGTFNLYTEIVIDEGNLKGYIKPVLENVKLLNWDEEKGGFLKKAWEAMVAGVKQIFENSSKDQIATQIPIEGNLNKMNLNAGIWPTIWGLFKNAFVKALSKQTEDAIDFPLQENEGEK